jgi:hypothetical protein
MQNPQIQMIMKAAADANQGGAGGSASPASHAGYSPQGTQSPIPELAQIAAMVFAGGA